MPLSDGATDASMMPPWARSKLFVRERFSNAMINLDIPRLKKTSHTHAFLCPR